MALRVGSRVRSTGETAHTDLGVIRFIPDTQVTRAVIVSFDCGCAAYVPVRRLEESSAPRPKRHNKTSTVPRAAASAALAAATEQSFDSMGSASRSTGDLSPARSEQAGASIDDRSTRGTPRTASHAARRGEQAATRGALRPRTRSTSTPASVSRAARPRPATLGPGRPKVWTREKIIAALRAFEATHGRGPRRSDWKKCPDGSHPAESVVRKTFGSFRAACEAAGVAYERGPREPWTREAIIENMRAYAQEFGRAPSAHDFAGAQGAKHPNTSTVLNRFGTWRKALDAAGLKPNPSGIHRSAPPSMVRRLEIATDALRHIAKTYPLTCPEAAQALAEMGDQ